jgi:hypothetical protein
MQHLIAFFVRIDCLTAYHLFYIFLPLHTVKLRKRRVMTSSFDIRRPLSHYCTTTLHAFVCCIFTSLHSQQVSDLY